VPGRVRAAVAAVAAVAALSGCGLGPGPGTHGVTVTVTQDFGARSVGAADERRVPGSETVMRALQRSFRVSTRYGGGYVQSIGGHAGTSDQHDWFYYVNGIQAPQGAATTAVHHGDHIWFDLHDWHATQSIPAVVGAFPEPFADGVNGKRYPTTIECATDVDAACKRVASALSAAGVPAASQLLGTGSGQDTVGVVVAPWREVAGAVGGTIIAHGPSASGIYARFVQGGARLQLFGPSGAVATTLGTGAGLVAATADNQSAPTWLITGTDARGVAAAAAALTPQALHDHFALAVSGARRIPVPVGTG